MMSELEAYIRENRVAINALTSASGFGSTALTVAAGTTSLSIGTELGAYGLEIVVVTGAGLADIATILGGTDGQVKIFIFQDNNIDFVDGNIKSGGAFYLNHLPAGSDFSPSLDDVIALVNINGVPGTTQGYWKELFRTLSVK